MTTAITAPEAPARDAPCDVRPETDDIAEPKPYRFTADQVLKMAEYGIFHPEDRVELIEGELIYMVPPGSRHNSASIRVDRVFQRLLGDDQALVAVNISIQIGERSLPMPDVVLLKPRADEYEDKIPVPEDIILVIEVSHSTLRADRTRKLALYAAAEIPAYWIHNVADRVIEAHSDPVDGEYTTRNIYRPGDTITLASRPDITLNASDILLPANQR